MHGEQLDTQWTLCFSLLAYVPVSCVLGAVVIRALASEVGGRTVVDLALEDWIQLGRQDHACRLVTPMEKKEELDMLSLVSDDDDSRAREVQGGLPVLISICVF